MWIGSAPRELCLQRAQRAACMYHAGRQTKRTTRLKQTSLVAWNVGSDGLAPCLTQGLQIGRVVFVESLRFLARLAGVVGGDGWVSTFSFLFLRTSDLHGVRLHSLIWNVRFLCLQPSTSARNSDEKIREPERVLLNSPRGCQGSPLLHVRLTFCSRG